jgi:hypothetical protein
MIKRWAYIRQTIPPGLWIGLFIFGSFLLLLPIIPARLWQIELSDEYYQLWVGWLSVAAGGYAFFRVYFFHPLYRQDYIEWLSLSPYDDKKRLPFGPVHLVETDVFVLAILYYMAYLNLPGLAVIPVIIFMGVYLFLNWIVVGDSQGHICILMLFLFPFVYYPSKNLWISLAVLTVFYGIFYLAGFGLKKFPWGTSWWKCDPLDKLRKLSHRHIISAWPFNSLYYRSGQKFGMAGILFLSILITWWVHILWWAVGGIPIYGGLLAIFIFNSAFLKVLYYYSLCHPPISLLGRVCNFRLIIPRYDKVFIGPICTVIFGAGTPLVLHNFGVSSRWSFEIAVFVTVLTLGFGPSLSAWKLTAQGRIPKRRLPESRNNYIQRAHSPVAGAVQRKFNCVKIASGK